MLSTKSRLFLLLSISLAIITLIFSVIQIAKLLSKNNSGSSDISPTITLSPTPTPDPLRPISVLLMGYGGGSHDGGSLTDSIILANIIPRQKKVNLISIPRDLWVMVENTSPEPRYSKINYAYPLGGGTLSKEVVGRIAGIIPDYFIALDFTAFTKTVDLLGGLDLKITQPFVDNYYPIEELSSDPCGKTPEEIVALEATMSGDRLDQQFVCRYERLVFSVGTTHVDGVTALKYARSRHSETAGGDFNRSNRQRQVISAIRDKFMKVGIITKVLPIYKTIVAHTQTDLTTKDIEKYLFKVPEYAKYQIVSTSLNDKNVLTQGTTPKGQSILMPKEGLDQYQGIQSFIASSSATSH